MRFIKIVSFCCLLFVNSCYSRISPPLWIARGGTKNNPRAAKLPQTNFTALETKSNSQHRNIWAVIVEKLISFWRFLLGEEESVYLKQYRKSQKTFVESIRQFIVESETKGNALESGQHFLEGPFVDCLKSGHFTGKPLLVVVLPFASFSGKRALVDARVLKLLKKQGIKVWGCWATGCEVSQVYKIIKGASLTHPIFAIIRPHQKDSHFHVLSVYPSSRSFVHSPTPSGRRLHAWIASTLGRFRDELESDYRIASDRAIQVEVRSSYEEALGIDVETQKQKNVRVHELQRMEVEAKENEETLQLRRGDLTKSLGDEPPKKAQGAVNMVVRLEDGRRVSRRFLRAAQIHQLFDWLELSFGIEPQGLQLRTKDGSFMLLGRLQNNASFVEAGWAERRDVLIAEHAADLNS